MKALAFVVVVTLGALLQVTVAPMFPVRAAIVDVGLVVMTFMALAGGPRRAMAAAPLMALFVAFASNRAPGLLLVGYLPLLPLAYFLEGGHLPLSRYGRLVAAVLVAGLWGRTVLSVGAFVDGADFVPLRLISEVLLPGLVLDFFAFTSVYIPFRALGWTNRSLTLQRTGW